MYYPEYIIEQIREETDILSIISEYTALTKRGNNHVGLCPFHNEKTPSFSVSEDKQMYYCFGCGAGGNVITFIMQKENMTFPEALAHLADRAHMDIVLEETSPQDMEKYNKKQLLLEIHTQAARFFYHTLSNPQSLSVQEYLESRGIDKNIIKRFGIGYASPNYNILYDYLKNQGYNDALLLDSGLFIKSKKGMLFDRFSDRVIFPIFNLNKKVIAFGGRIINEGSPKYLNSPESILFDKSSNLYGLNWAREQKHPYYILVEGYMDVIAMHKAGFTQTVASLGTAFTIGHAKLLKRYTEEVIILYDSDLAGNNAALRAIPILKATGLAVKVLQLTSEKDPDDYLKNHSVEEMKYLLDTAQSDTWFKVTKLKEKYDLDYPEQKVKFLQEVAILIAELTSSIEQDIYMKEIMKQYQIDYIALETEVKKYYNQSLGNKNLPIVTKNPIVPLKTGSNIQVDLLSVLYHYPYVYEAIKTYIFPELFESEFLKDASKHILEALKTQTEVDVTYFNNKYAEIKEQNMLSRIFMNKDERYEEAEVLGQMLTETIKRLSKHYIEKQLKQTKELTEVQELLFKKKVLDKLYIAFING